MQFRATRVLETIIQSFFDAYLFKMSRVKTLLQNVEDDFGEVLGGRHQRCEIRQRVEILMVEAVEHGLPNCFIEIDQITHHPGIRTDLTADGHFERVVMAVPMRIVAFPVGGAVLLV